MTILVGDDGSGRVLEIGVDRAIGGDVIAHAMPARQKYLCGGMPRPLQEIIDSQDEIADWFEQHGPCPDNPIPASDYFLGLLADFRGLDTDTVSGAVELARNAGADWQQIGEVLGASADAAQERFGALAAPSKSAVSARSKPS